ncbi:MAG: hypothetical protein SV186_01995 [Candidatus Nanohaloarchaea archaeon]|nr:hypothetical protein [Candidatus Nanohaloarchaea archaeon]
MSEDLDQLADAVEDWKQAKYFVERLTQSLFDADVDPEKFKDEFVQDGHPVDQKLFDLAADLAGER